MPDTGVLIDGGAAANASPHEQLRQADRLRESGQLDAAETLYREVLEHSPGGRGALLGLGFSARKRGERPVALAFFRRAASLDPQDRFARLAAADELRELGRLDEAEAQYREIIAAEPGNRGALIGLALTARKRGDRTGALAWLRRAAEADPDNPFIAHAIGDELRETGDIDGAERQYQTLFDRMPRHYGAWLGLGFCAQRRGNRVRALECFRNAATADPKAIFPLLAAADELRELGRIEEAEAEYGKVLASHPDHEPALLGLGFCARRRGERKSALDWFRRAAATGSTNVFCTLAIGDELFHLWRLDEAELHYRRALDHAPVRARALLGLGNCALRRGDPARTRRWLEEALIAGTDDREVTLSIGEAMRDCGDDERAIAVIENVLSADPSHVRAWLALGRLHRIAARPQLALEAFAKSVEIAPGSSQPLIEMAIEERALGRFAAAKRLVECAIAVDRDDMSAVVALADFLMLERDFDGALALYQQAIAGQQPALKAYLGASTARLHMGQLNDGLALLDEAEKRLGIHPAIAARRCDLLRAAGDWHAALETARESTALFPDHFWLWRGRMEIERRVGNPELAERLLHSPPVVTVQDRSQLDFLLGQIAAEKWQFTDAIGHFADALEKNPHHGGAAWNLAQLSLLTLDLPQAREYLRRHLSIEASGRIAKGLSHHESQTQIGQLLDEYELEPAALAEMIAIRDLPVADRIAPLKSVAARFSDYTAAAVTLLIALRQAGRFSPPAAPLTDTVSPPIPRRIAQFWDSEAVPADVSVLMASWRAQHPEWEYELFDNAAARRFLRTHFSPAVLSAYNRARETAQKSDIFRLGYLVTRGGYYVDADDRSLAPITTLVPSECELALYQEDYGTIGNDFLGAVPHHPVLTRALSTAVEAINRGDSDIVWLATGPGLLTRAFVQEMLQAENGVATALNAVAVLDRCGLYRAVAIHCSAAYKQTSRHWSNAVFSRRSRNLPLAANPTRGLERSS